MPRLTVLLICLLFSPMTLARDQDVTFGADGVGTADVEAADVEAAVPATSEVSSLLNSVASGTPNQCIDQVFKIYHHALEGGRRVRPEAIEALTKIADMRTRSESWVARNMLKEVARLEHLFQPAIAALRNERSEIIEVQVECNTSPLEPALRGLALNKVKSVTIRGLTEPEDLVLLRQCPQLESLTIPCSTIQDSDVGEITRLANLKCLKFYDCKNLSARSLSKQRSLPTLVELWLSGTQIKNLAALRQATNLVVMRADAASLRDNGLQAIGSSGLSRLKTISLTNANHITDDGLRTLHQRNSVEELTIISSKITGRGLTSLLNRANLKQLNLADSEVATFSVAENS